MNINAPHRFRHFCEISEPRATKDDSPYLGKWTKRLRQLRNLMIVRRCSDSLGYYRSHAEYMKARKVHLSDPGLRYIIHPFSTFHRRESTFTFWLWLWTAVMENYAGTFLGKELYKTRSGQVYMVTTTSLYFANVVFLLEVIIRMFTGYEEEVTRSVVLDHKMIVRGYLKTYFFFDMAPIVGFMVFYYLEGASQFTFMCVFQLHKLRLSRCRTVLKQMNRSLEYFRVPQAIKNLIELIVLALLMVHVLTCLSGLYITFLRVLNIKNTEYWYTKVEHDRARHAVRNVDEWRGWQFMIRYLTHMDVITSHFFGLIDCKYHTHDPIEMAFLSLVLVAGLWYYIFCVARVMQYVEVTQLSDFKYEELTINADYYMRSKNFTPLLKTRIDNYYQYKFNKKYFDEDSILHHLSEHLQMEVLLYSCQNLINRVHIFKGLSKSAVGCLLSLLKRDIFVPMDKILTPDDDTENLYFILFGTCGIEVMTGKEIMHIEDGDHFGNLTGFQLEEDGPKLLYAVVALEMVEVYSLSKKDIVYSVRMYPEIQAKLEVMEKTRLWKYNRLFSIRDDNDDVTEDIVNELRKGRIIWHGITRDSFR